MVRSRGSFLVNPRMRWIVVALISSALVINFLNRQTSATVAPVLPNALDISNTDYPLMVVVFLIAMGIFQIPAGWLIDRKGPRFGFSFLVSWWSVASGPRALARTVFRFWGLRFLLWVVECEIIAGN